jgi:hypothetical protein
MKLCKLSDIPEGEGLRVETPLGALAVFHFLDKTCAREIAIICHWATMKKALRDAEIVADMESIVPLAKSRVPAIYIVDTRGQESTFDAIFLCGGRDNFPDSRARERRAVCTRGLGTLWADVHLLGLGY